MQLNSANAGSGQVLPEPHRPGEGSRGLWVEGPHHQSQPACPGRASHELFLPLVPHCTSSGAANCGSRLRKLAYESPSDCPAQWRLLGLLVPTGRKLAQPPRLGCSEARRGKLKLREARGPQRDWRGRGCKLGAHPMGWQSIPHPTECPPGWAMHEGSRDLSASTYPYAEQVPAKLLSPPPRAPSLPLAGQGSPKQRQPQTLTHL